MRAACLGFLILLLSAAGLSSKDKTTKVTFEQMAAGMRDAFNCGVVVEEYLHGPLKDKPNDYHKMRQQNNCDYVESVLNKLPDQH